MPAFLEAMFIFRFFLVFLISFINGNLSFRGLILERISISEINCVNKNKLEIQSSLKHGLSLDLEYMKFHCQQNPTRGTLQDLMQVCLPFYSPSGIFSKYFYNIYVELVSKCS